MRIAALFAGIAGLELGLHAAGHHSVMFCEIDKGAQEVLSTHFPSTPLIPDIRDVDSLPEGTDLVTAGFPCQDLSQAGTTNGINGRQSSIVAHLFRILKRSKIQHVLIENVPFMLQLHKGQAINYLVSNLERLGYSWAYRVVNAQSFGIPQRRERVFLIASKTALPWNVLFEQNEEPPIQNFDPSKACGFYWTEGKRGLGWADNSIPTLKGGSSLGIPSPPAIWMPNGRIVKPSLRDAERLQGLIPDWTLPAENVVRQGYRWRLVGNAVSVGSSTWIGERLAKLESATKVTINSSKFDENKSWPTAAYGFPSGTRFAVTVSKWPRLCPTPDLLSFLQDEPEDLSLKATSGFLSRLKSGSLRYRKEFLTALTIHQHKMRSIEGGANSGRKNSGAFHDVEQDNRQIR